MFQRQRFESLSERLRSEVQQMSTALWQIKPSMEETAANDERKLGQRLPPDAYATSPLATFPCPHQVKPLQFFYKYLQPIGTTDLGRSLPETGGPSTTYQRKLRLNLPLTVVCERSSAQELVLWLRTDAQGNVMREEKTVLWREKLQTELSVSPAGSNESESPLAVRSVAGWKGSNRFTGGSVVVLTRQTLESVLAVPCERPTCIQQFVHCRGSQASVYRVFWCKQERKCFAVNLTSSLKSTKAPADNPVVVPPNSLSTATMEAKDDAFEAAMVTAAQTACIYCVTVSPDALSCARWPKLRGAAIAEGVQATSRIVDHVQLQLPTMRFHSMTVDFIKDTSGVWWLTRVVDFQASSFIELPRDDGCFDSRDSAVLIHDALRIKQGRSSNELKRNDVDGSSSPQRDASVLRGNEVNNTSNARICFLCSCSCELSSTFQSQVEATINGQSSEEHNEYQATSLTPSVSKEFRMTLTMALDTIYLLRQRGVCLPVWELAVSYVRKSQLRDVCDFPVCMLCYRIYQEQNRVQQIARELHDVFSPTTTTYSHRLEGTNEAVSGSTTDLSGVCMTISAASGLAGSQGLSSELRVRPEAPKTVLDALEAFQAERTPSSLLLQTDSPELRLTWSALKPVHGADMDPTSKQLRLVFFFHELQDAGPDLVATDFFLEYQLGQNVTQVPLEGSKMHTPNRWQLCEARVHYLCATSSAFRDFCAHKRLLIKLKAKAHSRHEIPENDEDDRRDSFKHPDSSCRGPQRYREKDEFFGYTLLPLRTVITTAKWFENSPRSESRTEYLLELHTATCGLLTLKVTVGLVIDPVPLGHVRDVLRDLVFLEEEVPRGVYWPPQSYCIGGLTVPQDWINALMPSEYTKTLPMHHRHVRGTRRKGAAPSKPHAAIAAMSTSFSDPQLASNADFGEPTTASLGPSTTPRHVLTRSSATKAKNGLETAQESALTGGDIAGSHGFDQVRLDSEAQLQHSMDAGMTLSTTCVAARRILSCLAEDAAISNFPIVLLAVILRYTSFAMSTSTLCTPSTSSLSWNLSSRFQLTQRYSLDHLLTEAKPGNLPMLALLGELLLVLSENHLLPVRVNARALESLLEPFWQHDSGWRSISRTQSRCLPEQRAVWNRAIRHWEVATGGATSNETTQSDTCLKPVEEDRGAVIAVEIGDFRAKTLALGLCELFEQMESLDNGYIEIAELRSLAKCLLEHTSACSDELLNSEIGTCEALTQDDVDILAKLVKQQRHRAVRTLLHSLMESSVMIDALARFDQVGSGEMSYEQFRELAFEAILTRRKVFHAFKEEPTTLHDGFCLRHGLTDIYKADSVCVACATEYQVSKPANTSESSPESPQSIIAGKTEITTAIDAAQRPNVDPEENQRLALVNTRRALSLSSDSKLKVDTETGYRRLSSWKTSSHARDFKMVHSTLDRLHATEQCLLLNETDVSERKADRLAAQAWQSCEGEVTDVSPTDSNCLENTEQKSIRRAQSTAQVDIDVGPAKGMPKTRKRTKRKVLNKTTQSLKALPSSASLSKLLRMEFADHKRSLETSVSETIIEKAERIEERRKQLDRLVLAEVQEVKQRLAKLLNEACT